MSVAVAEWLPVRVSDYRLRALRDRHYSTDPRHAGAKTVGAPGRRLAFVTFEGTAGWISHYRYSGLQEGYVCSFFRNEGAGLASELILAAIAATEERWGPPPRWITLIDTTKIRHKRDPGRCFRRAGFLPAGYTKDRHLLILVLDRSAARNEGTYRESDSKMQRGPRPRSRPPATQTKGAYKNDQ